MVRYETGVPPLDQVLEIYRSLGWIAHRIPERVARAHANSSRIVSAWDGERLVGWVRVITDGEFCLYVHEILLHPDYQRQGLGRELLDRALKGYEEVQVSVLLSDPGNEPFYERFGFAEVKPEVGFRAMYRLGRNWGT